MEANGTARLCVAVSAHDRIQLKDFKLQAVHMAGRITVDHWDVRVSLF